MRYCVECLREVKVDTINNSTIGDDFRTLIQISEELRDKINNIGRKCITNIGPNIKVEMLTYVDDLNYANSNLVQIKKAVADLRCMDKCKGLTFNNEKNKTELMIVNKKRNKYCNDIKLEVKCEEIYKINEYKYLGEWSRGGGVTTYIFLIRMYPVKTKGEPKAGAGFLTNYQPKSGSNHICYKNATQSRGVAEWRSLKFIVYFIETNLLVFY